MNRANVLRIVCETPGLTRQEVANRLGLSKMSAVNIITEYVEKGYFRESLGLQQHANHANVGRPSYSVYPVPESVVVLGIYVAESEIICSLINMDGKPVVSQTIEPTRQETAEELFAKMDNLMDSVLQEGEDYKDKLFGIGVSTVGLVDAEEGVLLRADIFPNVFSMPLKKHYEEKYKLPVIVSNDMHASLIAERCFGEGRNKADFVYIGVGGSNTGIGMCINNKVFHGHNGFAGEIGYTTINFEGEPSRFGYPGQLRAYSCVDAYVEKVNRDWQERLPDMPHFPENRPITWKDIIHEAKTGNPYCINIIHTIGDYLAIAIVNIVNLLDPEKVVIGGQLAAAESLIIDHLKERTYDKSVKKLLNTPEMRKKYPQTNIVLSIYMDRIMAVGAGAIVYDALFQGKLSLME